MSQVTNARLYNRYKAATYDKNDKLMASYLLLLKNRAALGSSEAQKYVDKITK